MPKVKILKSVMIKFKSTLPFLTFGFRTCLELRYSNLSVQGIGREVNPADAKKPDKTDMGKPFGKASRRTFIRNGTPLSLTSWNSPKVKSSDHIKNLKTTAFRSLEGRFAYVR